MKQIIFIGIIFIGTIQIALGQFPLKKEKIDYKNIKSIQEYNGLDLIVYQYSPNGEITHMLKKSKSGITYRKSNYFYNNHRQIVLVKNYMLISKTSGLIYVGKKEYFYDTNNHSSEIKQYSWGIKEPTNIVDKQTTLEYNKNGLPFKIIEIKYRYNGTIAYINKETITYNEVNKIQRKIIQLNGQIQSVDKFFYDQEGRLLKMEEYYPKSSDYSYVSPKFIKNLNFTDYNGTQLESKPRGETIFKYDSNGHLTKEIYINHFMDYNPYIISFSYTFYNEQELQDKNNDISFK
jgi:hypothetical protein